MSQNGGELHVSSHVLQKYVEYFRGSGSNVLGDLDVRQEVSQQVLALLSPGISEGPFKESFFCEEGFQEVYYYPSVKRQTHRIIVRGGAVVQIEEIPRNKKERVKWVFNH